MNDIQYKIKRLIKIIIKFVAGSSEKNHLRLKFGDIRTVLRKSGAIMLNSKRPFYESGMLKWVKKRGGLFIIPDFEANPHIIISGMSGFGKSTLFKSILSDIRKFGISCIVFDAHNEHSDIVRELGGYVYNALYSGINLLELDGASISERISELSRMFKEVYSLGYIQTTKLSDCLWYTYRKAGARSRSDRDIAAAPSLKGLLDELNIFIKNSRSLGERNTLLHLRDRLSLLNSSAFNTSFINMREMHNGLHSVSLAGMKSKEAQLIYVGELLNRLYSSMHDSKKRNAVALYIMIDEAQFLVDNSNNNSIIAKLIEEGRKYGVGVIIVTHAAITLNKKIMTNSSTFVTFYAREPSEVSYITKIISGNNPNMVDSIRNMISLMKQNQAILISNRFREPVLISTPSFKSLEVNSSGSGLPENEIIELLKSKAKRPLKYSEIKALDPGIQDAILTKLVNLRFLDRFVLYSGKDKEEWLMLHNNSISIEHEVWTKKLSEALNSGGIQNRVIDNSKGPDILAVCNGKRIAVEYETGSKSFESTSRMMDSRVEKYDKTIIVTNDAALQYYKTCFGINGITVISTKEIESVVDIILKQVNEENQ